MSSAKEYPLYIDNIASKLRAKSAQKKREGVRSRSINSRRAKSANVARRTARSNRNPLEYFNPSNFEKIQMHYGENPKSQDCSELTEKVESLESQLNGAKNDIESKDDKIKDLDKKLTLCNIKNAAKRGTEVGKKIVADILSKQWESRNDHKSAAAGGKRRRKSTTKKTQKKRRSNKFSIFSYFGIRG
jgi:hypothetical protein